MGLGNVPMVALVLWDYIGIGPDVCIGPTGLGNGLMVALVLGD